MNSCYVSNQTLKLFIEKHPRNKRMYILYKIMNYLHLKQKANKHNKGQLSYVFEFLMKPENICKFVKQGNVLLYCDKRRSEDTKGVKNNFKDNSRQVEKMRKNIYPLEWVEVLQNGELWFKHMPQNKKYICHVLCEQHKHKSNSFSKGTIEEKMILSNYKCCITGIPQDNDDLAADHFIPKEKGGKSDWNNCIIINKILNEKKNKNYQLNGFAKPY